MKINIAKVFLRVGDIEFNYNKIIEIYDKSDCDLLIFPEMSLTGYPLYDLVQQKEFIEKNNEYLEKIVNYTVNKKTKILLGCPYFIDEHTNRDGIIIKSKLFNSVLFINDGYIDCIVSKNTIVKDNIFDDYRYFDRETHLRHIEYDTLKFNVLIADDIFESKNIIFLRDRDNDLIICLDSSLQSDMNSIKKQLNKISKFTKKHIIYLNNFSYDFQRNFQFNGQCFIINSLGEMTYENERISEEIIELKTKITNGKVEIGEIINTFNKNEDFINILARNYNDKIIATEINSNPPKNLEKNIKLFTFDKIYAIQNIQHIDMNNYINTNNLDSCSTQLQNFIINNIFNKKNILIYCGK